jgi:glycosyltransferase involved in cell wall biosynthesis
MKITILTDQIEGGGGAGVVAMNHARALVFRGHEVEVITTSTDKEKLGEKNEAGVKIHTLYSNYRVGLRAYVSLNHRSVVKQVNELLLKNKPDIVHAHNIHLHLSYAVLKGAKKHAKALFLTVHDSMPFHYSKLFPASVHMDGDNVISYKVSPWEQFRHFGKQYNPFRNGLIKKYLELPTKIFAVSRALKQALEDNGIQNVEVLHNGIEAAEWQSGKTVDEGKYIFFGGRLSSAKGAPVLLEAMRQVIDHKPEAKILVVAEENDYAEKMKDKAWELGMDDSVLEFTGYKSRTEMKEMYARATLVVVPSLCFDWFPTIILEAMASRKPVIATCFGGAKEMVEDGQTGFIINPQNTSELAEKILFLLKNSTTVSTFGQAGFERVKKEFSMDKHIENLLTWYHNALK